METIPSVNVSWNTGNFFKKIKKKFLMFLFTYLFFNLAMPGLSCHMCDL